MLRKSIISAGVFFILAASVIHNSAQAESRALVALYDGANGWERAGRLQELLEEKYGFFKAQVLVNSTPAEVPARVREFLSEPGNPGDKRFVWVSGMGPENENSPCPNSNLSRVRPSVDTLLLAPECYSDLVSLPYGAKHISVGRSSDGTPKRVRKSSRVPAIALLTLPSDKPEFVESADRLIMKVLQPGKFRDLHPYRLLDNLRNGFRDNGSDYMPSLDIVAWRGAFMTSAQMMIVPDIHPSRQDLGAADRARPLLNILRVYGPTKENSEPALHIYGNQPVNIFRTDSSGRMVFVRVRGGRYGWVNSSELQMRR